MKKELNWNDNVLGQPLIKVRDFLRYRKFKSVTHQDITDFFKGEVDEKKFMNELIELGLITEITKKNMNIGSIEYCHSDDIGSFMLTDFGVRFTTKKKIKQRDKKYCDKLIEEIKSKAYELNRISACPIYVSEIKVFGSYLYKKHELLNDLDVSIKVERKTDDDFNDKCHDFCDLFDIKYYGNPLGAFGETYSFITKELKHKNSFLHIIEHSDIGDGWKTEKIFSEKLDSILKENKKAIIVFNDSEKIVEITDVFYEDYTRSVNEMRMFFNESADEQYENSYENWCKKIISLIENKFSIKIDEDNFSHEELRVSKDDLKKNIVLNIVAETIE